MQSRVVVVSSYFHLRSIKDIIIPYIGVHIHGLLVRVIFGSFAKIGPAGI